MKRGFLLHKRKPDRSAVSQRAASTSPPSPSPTIVVESDFDGYFERLVLSLVARKKLSGAPFKHEKVLIRSGPYRFHDVQWESSAGTLTLDFYSPCRKRGGPDGINEIIAQL